MTMTTWTVALQGIFTPFAIKVGLACLASQCLCFVILRYLDANPSTAGPWSRRAGFTAHQLVTFPVLAYLTVEGLRLWIYDTPETDVQGRMLDYNDHFHLSEFVLGMMAFWDLPTSILTRELRQPAMLLHHIFMFWTAAVSMGFISEERPLMGYYAPFYFGAIELSSLPLLIVDIFHPKHRDWHAWLTHSDSPKWLAKVNEVSRATFAVLFLLVRVIWFPYVSFFGVLRDVTQVQDGSAMLGLYLMASFNVFFSGLQMYWGTLVIKQAAKILFGKKDKKV
jgi:TLC domain